MSPAQARPDLLPAVARLLIRAGKAAGHAKAGDPQTLWQRVLARRLKPKPAAAQPPLQVEVSAEQGRRLFVLCDPEGSIDMTVGPGTYDITVVQGSRRRRYTVPLAAGATFALDLQDAMPASCRAGTAGQEPVLSESGDGW